MSTTIGGGLDTDSFEFKRVLRQEAHERAFEIKVQAQRLFEKEKEKIVLEGKDWTDQEIEGKIWVVQQDINIARSTRINKSRMELMNLRNEFMKKIVNETLIKLQTEKSIPSNPLY